MTNKSNDNQPENECIPCSAYEYFVSLSKTNDTKEAFLDAMDFVIEHLIDDLADVVGGKAYADGHEDGFDSGFAAAYSSIAEEMTHVAKELNESIADCPCDTCDCEADDECKVDADAAEDKTRNAIRED